MKRLKLLLSFVAFVFCLGGLAFGVYSAIQIEYKTSGSINYEVNDVFTKVETQIYHSTSTQLTTEKQLRENIVTFADGEIPQGVELHTGEGAENLTPIITYDPDTEQALEKLGETLTKQSGVDLTYGKYNFAQGQNSNSYAYYLLVTITNYGNQPIHASVSNASTFVNTFSLHSGNVGIPGRTPSKFFYSKTIVLGLTLRDFLSTSTGDIDFTVTVSKGDLPQEPEPEFDQIDIVDTSVDNPQAYITQMWIDDELQNGTFTPANSVDVQSINIGDTLAGRASTTEDYNITKVTLYMYSLSSSPYLRVRISYYELPSSTNFQLVNSSVYLPRTPEGEQPKAVPVDIYFQNKDTSSIDISNLQSFLKFEPVDTLMQYDDTDADDPYYYVEMGTYKGTDQVEYIRWRYVTSDLTGYAQATNPKDTTTLSDLTGMYIQETYVDEYSSSNSIHKVSWENSYIYESGATPYYHHTETGLEKVPANEYRASNIRKYLNLTNDDVVSKDYSYSSSSGYYGSGVQSNLCNDLNININSDIIYNQITARPLTNSEGTGLYDNMKSGISGGKIECDTSYGVTYPDGEGSIDDNNFDKFWLPSFYEMYKLFKNDSGGNTTGSCPSRVWHTQSGSVVSYYWLRSPNSGNDIYASYVHSSGNLYNVDLVYSCNACRAAFQIASGK